jgi:hypothetical protein
MWTDFINKSVTESPPPVDMLKMIVKPGVAEEQREGKKQQTAIITTEKK